MTEQLALTGTEPAPKPLRPRQQQAVDYLTAHPGATAEDVGAWLHSLKDRRPHPAGERCDYCARDGSSVLRSKGLRPLVTYRNEDGRRLYRLKGDVAAPERPAGGVIATSCSDPAVNPWADLGAHSPAEVPSGDLAEVTESA